MYYALIILSTAVFACGFLLNDVYRKSAGSTVKASLQYTFLSSLAGLIALFLINGFLFEFTPFAFIIALLTAINGFGFSFCAFKALNHINLSVYSVFSMLGGMLLPFLQGIFFYGEKLTIAKALCLVFIVAALLCTIEKGKAKGFIYYIGIFTLNGTSGVLSKIFASSNLPKTSAAGYSILTALCSTVIAAFILVGMAIKNKEPFFPCFKATIVSAVGGISNRLANFWLVIALMHVDASIQYPLVTGGVMIGSTIASCFTENKPKRNDIISVVLAFIGMLILFVIPI